MPAGLASVTQILCYAYHILIMVMCACYCSMFCTCTHSGLPHNVLHSTSYCVMRQKCLFSWWGRLRNLVLGEWVGGGWRFNIQYMGTQSYPSFQGCHGGWHFIRCEIQCFPQILWCTGSQYNLSCLLQPVNSVLVLCICLSTYDDCSLYVHSKLLTV